MSLVQTDWNDPDSPIKLNDGLSLEALQGAIIVSHTRLFLSSLNTDKGVKLTAAGNLNRKYVEQMLDEFSWPGQDIAEIRRMNKVINEEDFSGLHFIRVACEVAKLTRKYKGTLRLSRLGRSLLEDGSAGLLMSELFIGIFQRFNLAYMDRFDVEDSLTPQMSLILYGISKLANDYVSPDELANLTLDPIECPGDYLTPDMIFEDRVLRYLCWFGLMEKRAKAANDQRFRDYLYRKTPLFDQFLSFNLVG